MKTIMATMLGLLATTQAFAGEANTGVPEMDGAGLIIGIALAAGLVALFREKFFRK